MQCSLTVCLTDIKLMVLDCYRSEVYLKCNPVSVVATAISFFLPAHYEHNCTNHGRRLDIGNDAVSVMVW